MNTLIGIDKILEEINLIVKNNHPIPHIELTGTRGTGKTTLVRLIAEVSKQPIVELHGTALDSKNIWGVLFSIQENQILFIDEIHRLHPKTEEILYQPMESGELSVNYGGVLQTIPFTKFTLIGATTRPGLVSKPLQSRFKIHIHIPNYEENILAKIIQLKNPSVSPKDSKSIAGYVSVPRDALHLTYRLLNLSRPINDGLKFLGYKNGFTPLEIKYLQTLKNVGTLSLDTVCSILQQDKDEIKLVEERLLFKGMINIQARGRELTPVGWVELRKL